jgi:hypothetical protein
LDRLQAPDQVLPPQAELRLPAMVLPRRYQTSPVF